MRDSIAARAQLALLTIHLYSA